MGQIIHPYEDLEPEPPPDRVIKDTNFLVPFLLLIIAIEGLSVIGYIIYKIWLHM